MRKKLTQQQLIDYAIDWVYANKPDLKEEDEETYYQRLGFLLVDFINDLLTDNQLD